MTSFTIKKIKIRIASKLRNEFKLTIIMKKWMKERVNLQIFKIYRKKIKINLVEF